jgi:hypothetical protein
VTGACENGYETSGFVKCGESGPVEEGSSVWSWLDNVLHFGITQSAS